MRAFGIRRSFGIALSIVAIASQFVPNSSAAPGPGIVQVTWNANEIGTEVFRFPASLVGPQPTMLDFQHGYLYIGAAHSLIPVVEVPGRVSWWDLSNPRSPSLITYVLADGNKPHMAAFWEDKMLDGFQDTGFRTWDFDDKTQLGSYSSTVNPMWYAGQLPYVFRMQNGYLAGPRSLEVVKLNASGTGGSQIKVWDARAALSFSPGVVHAVGNLLLMSSVLGRGVATVDISDPTNPTVLDEELGINSVGAYTSMVHGSRLYQAEIDNGIRVFDFADPSDIQEIGFIEIPEHVRYVNFKDGKGYIGPATNKILRFDTQTLAIDQTWTIPGRIDFVQLVGNMAITGGASSAETVAIIPIQEAPDTTGPTVGFISPANGSQFNAVTSRVGFIMSEPIDVTSLNSNTFVVRPQGSATAVAGTYSTQMGMINFAPSMPLAVDTAYEVILTANGVRDVVGNSMAAEYRSTFNTGAVDEDAPVAHWRLNNSGADSSAGAYPLSLFNGATYSQLEKQEGTHSLSLDGLDDYATPGAINLGDHFTIAAWVRTSGGSPALKTIISNSGSGSLTDGFRLFASSATMDGKIYFETGNGSVGATAETHASIFKTYVWNHVVVTVDRILGVARIYHNGEHRTRSWTVRTDFANDQPVELGRTANGLHFGGNLDDVRIFAAELTGTQVKSLFARGLVGRWGFNNSAADSSGNERTATLDGGAAFHADRIEGIGSLATDGSGDFANIAAFGLGEQFTIAMWTKLPSTETDSRLLMANSNDGLVQDGFRFFVNTPNTNDGRILFEAGNGGSGLVVQSPADIFDFDRWNHVAALVDRATGSAQLFYNGAPVASGALPTNFGNDDTLRIAALLDGSRDTVGKYDDVRIYNRLLTPEEVAAMADSGNDVPVSGALTVSDPEPLIGSLVTVNANVTDSDPDDVLLYSFSFGDGSPSTPFSTSSTASKIYTAPGRYFITARISDGASLTTQQRLVVAHHPPTSPAPVASSQIIYDASRGKTWCVNPDSDTLTRIGGTPPFAKEVEVPTGKKPRSVAITPDGSALWVACEGSDEIQVFDPGSGAVMTTKQLDYGAAPVAVAFAPDGSAAFVLARGDRALHRMDIATLAMTGSRPLSGEPFSVAVSGDSSRVLVARFVSPETQGEVWEIDATTMALTRTFGLAIDLAPDTESTGRGLPNYLQGAVITPDGRRAWVPSKKDNILRGAFLDGQPLDHDNTVRSIISQLDLVSNQEAVGSRSDVDNHGLPGSLCFSPLGDIAFVANQGKNVVLAFDAASGNSLSSIETGRAPQSLCFDAVNSRLFVMNYLSRSIGVYDVAELLEGTSSAMTLLAETPVVAVELLSPNVLEGKRVFYNSADERMSAEGYISCASCHLDGGHDGRTWDFTDRGEGLRNTTDLRGRGGMLHGRVHWSANFDEIQDFEHDMRGGFGGTGFMSEAEFHTGSRDQPLGDSKAGVSVELDALAAYVASLTEVPRSPYRNWDGTLTDSALMGKAVFYAADCASCHSQPRFTDSPMDLRHDVGTMTAASGQRLGQPLDGIDTPTLLGLWEASPYHHLGDAASLHDVLGNAAHGTAGPLTAGEKNLVVSYLLELDRFESDADRDGLGDDWELAYVADLFILGEKGIPGSGSDTDGDSSSDAAEESAGTNPLDPNDSLRVVSMTDNGGTFEISWPSVAGKNYNLKWSSDLSTWTMHSSHSGTGAIVDVLVDKLALGDPDMIYFRVEISE